MSDYFKGIDDLCNWELISKGFYRYMVAADICYEIQISKRYYNEEILDARGCLYLVGDWGDGTVSFKRYVIAYYGTVRTLLRDAKIDVKSYWGKCDENGVEV